jgi:PAS domain S-box-containing protein
VRGGRLTAAVLAALVLSTVWVAEIEATTHTHSNGDVYFAFGIPVVWTFALAGLIATRRRPGNRTGPLMIAIGFAWLASALTDSRSDVVFTLGMALSNVWPGMLIHLLLAYPSGRLDRRSRIIVIGGYLDTLGVSLLLVPFSQPRIDGQGASPHSATNLFLVSHQKALIDVVQSVAFAGALVLLVAALAVVWRRWRTASPGARRVLAPMYATGGASIAVLLLAVGLLDIAGVLTSIDGFYAFSVTFTAIPIGYLFGILRTRLDRGSAVQTLVSTLRDAGSPGGVREALRAALNDPTLELAYRRKGTDEYVDENGERADLPAAGSGRETTVIEHDGEVVAAIVHAPVPLDETGLLDAVSGPAAIAIENERLAAELKAQIQEVTASAQRLRDVLENVHLAAVSLDLDGRIVFCNQYLADLSGWTREELVGSVWLERFPTGDPEYAERMRADRIRVHDERPLLTRSGDVRTISWSNTVDRYADGTICGSTSIGQDVTERDRSARQDAALRRLATMVAESAPAEAIFYAVTEEVARLLGGQTANLVRFDEGSSGGRVVAGWNQDDVVSMPLGEWVTFDGTTAVRLVIETGRPARIDDYSQIEGELAARLRSLGLSSSVAAPIMADGRMWGAMTVSTVGPAKLAADAEQRVGQFAEVVALCLSSTEARAELAASRARIVAAGDAERRRLERNLHDGAQQRLVSLSLDLRMARSTVSADSDTAALLDSASRELSDALEELRELARGIHPAVLTDQGLRAAIRALTARTPMPVDVAIELDRELPDQVEAALYYVAAEALTNVVKYARATSVQVTVATGDTSARVTVTDDGVGGADPAAGSGLRGLADRVEALGGRLDVSPARGGGTRVEARVPLAPAPAPAPGPPVTADRPY